jgi:RES domain-containing protein
MSLKDAGLSWRALETESAALFGSRLRLPIAVLASLADPDELYAARIAGVAEVDRKEATRELSRLQTVGLLVPGSVVDSGKPGRPAQLLERRNEQAWEALIALAARLKEQGSGKRRR